MWTKAPILTTALIGLSAIILLFVLSMHPLYAGTHPCSNCIEGASLNEFSHGNLHDAAISSTSNYFNLPTTTPNLNNQGFANVLVTTSTQPPFHMFVFPVDTDRYISKAIMKHGTYEPATTKLITDLLPNINLPSRPKLKDAEANSTHSICSVNLVVDLGSNLGYYSLLAASRGYNVVSFEASPDTAWLQRSSAALNGFSPGSHRDAAAAAGSLLIVNKGVSDVPSTARLSRHPLSPGMTSFALNEQFGLQQEAGSAIDTDLELVRADDVLSELGVQKGKDVAAEDRASTCYKLLKVDVEGYELKALHGLGGFDSYPFETIVLEYFPTMLVAAGVSDPMDVLRYIARDGVYEFSIINGDGSLSTVEDIEMEPRLKDIKGTQHVNVLAKRRKENSH